MLFSLCPLLLQKSNFHGICLIITSSPPLYSPKKNYNRRINSCCGVGRRRVVQSTHNASYWSTYTKVSNYGSGREYQQTNGSKFSPWNNLRGGEHMHVLLLMFTYIFLCPLLIFMLLYSDSRDSPRGKCFTILYHTTSFQHR